MLRILRKLITKKDSLSDFILNGIIDSRKRNIKYIAINLWIDDQILFQVGTAKEFTQYGIDMKDEREAFAFHFFNNKKTLTIAAWDTFKKLKDTDYLNFYTSGNDFYAKSMGVSPDQIVKNIKKEMELYRIEDKSKIRIQFVEN